MSNMYKTLSICLVALFLTSCQEDKQKPYVCSTNISDKICFQETFESELCSGKTNAKLKQKAVKQLRDILDHSPAYVQDKFCNLDRLIIANTPKENSWQAAEAQDNFIKIKSHLFDNSFDNDYAGISSQILLYEHKKSKTNAGGYQYLTDIDDITIDIKLPREHKSFINHNLANTLYHEIAHIVESNDFVLNMFHCLPENKPILPLKTVSYSNYCTKQLPNNLDSTILKKLENSVYPSFYATCTKHEHFAEIFSNHIVHKLFDIDYTISKKSQPIYKQSKQYNQPQMQPYNQVIKSLLALGEMTKEEREKAQYGHLECKGIFAADYRSE